VVADTTPQLGGNLDMVANLLVGNSGTTGIAIASTGEVTMAKQPAFSYVLSSSDANVTGGGTLYTLGASGNVLTKVFDQSDEVTTAGVFTPTVAGIYLLGCSIVFGNTSAIAAMDNYALSIVTTGQNWAKYGNLQSEQALTNSLGVGEVRLSSLFQMAASNTAKVTLQVWDSTDTLDIEAGNTTFYGYKVA
jgi:hypothetical protein